MISMPSYLVALLVSLGVSIVLVLTKRWHGRFSMDHTEGVQKFHTVPTPRIGGVAIVAGLFAGWCFASAAERTVLSTLLIASIPAFTFGILEDLTKRVGVTARLLATMSSGVLACIFTGIAINRSDIPLLDELLRVWPIAVLFTAFAVGGIANAINIIDGFNGLSSGSVLIILGSLGWIANGQGDSILAANCLLVAAAVLGFWLVNFPLGKLFLGDGGAYFVGFALAWLALSLPLRNQSVSPWVVMLALAYPVIEVLYSILRRMHNGNSAGAPDNMHLHSVIKLRLIMPRFKKWPAHFRNSAVSPIIWIFVLFHSILAIQLVGVSKWYVFFANLFCLLLYHFIYQYLTKDLTFSLKDRVS
jgi:UDP-N-acetylmuramyl pentapeptide phosphotransferase/UDP-N-acetylglucosamine-1-phosphate transferase